MNSKGKIFPKEIIEHWPEVFGEVKLNVLPLGYLHSVLINFKDGKIWEIKVTAQTRTDGWLSFESNLRELMQGYGHQIDNVDFKLDTKRVRRDVTRSTDKFFKKRKL